MSPLLLPFDVQKDRPRYLPLLTNLQAWFKADDLNLADGAEIASWPDASGNGRTATQATAAARPLMALNAINGRPATRWDGTAKNLKTPAYTQAQPDTFFVVGKSIILSGGFTFCDALTNLAHCFFRLNTVFSVTAGTTVPTMALDVNYHILAAQFNGVSSYVRKDGVSGSVATCGNGTINGLTIGSRGGGAFPMNGDIAEIMHYSGVLTADQLNQVGAYLSAKYNLPWTPA